MKHIKQSKPRLKVPTGYKLVDGKSNIVQQAKRVDIHGDLAERIRALLTQYHSELRAECSKRRLRDKKKSHQL